MKITLLLISIILNFQFGFSQEKKLNSDFFLFGTLNDYNGRLKSNCNKFSDVVEQYYNSDNYILKFNYTILKNNYPDLTIDSEKNILKSKILARKIDELYKFKFADGYCSDNEDENLIDSVFYGKIKKEIFKTKNERLSYLVGAFVKYGEINDNLYSIRIANSYSTFPICMTLLKQIGCKKVESKIIEAVPYNYIIFFKPTVELEEYLKYYQKLLDSLKN